MYKDRQEAMWLVVSASKWSLKVTLASEVTIMGYSSREQGFASQHSHGGSQSSLTPVSGDPMPFSGTRHTHGPQTYM